MIKQKYLLTLFLSSAEYWPVGGVLRLPTIRGSTVLFLDIMVMFVGSSISVTERTVPSEWNSLIKPERESLSPTATWESMDFEEVKTETPEDARMSGEGGPWIQNPDVLFAVTIPDDSKILDTKGPHS